jgi:hypothetical protein
MNFNPILLLSGLSATTMGIAAVVSIIAFVGYKSYRSSQGTVTSLDITPMSKDALNATSSLNKLENYSLLSAKDKKLAESYIEEGREISINKRGNIVKIAHI